MHETSGVLRPAVERYLRGERLSLRDIGALRAYLRQWITKGDFRGPEIAGLRNMVDSLTSREQIELWTERAMHVGIDPW
jgi:hypothetical protein